ncbi:hypothetical protein GJ496_005286, partial [Pomphorhynchus laevis]
MTTFRGNSKYHYYGLKISIRSELTVIENYNNLEVNGKKNQDITNDERDRVAPMIYEGNVGILEHSLDQREKMFTLEAKYEQYYMNIVQAVSENQVDRMEYLFCSFWRDNSSSVESAKLLDQFCRSDKGIAIVCHFDNIMYSAILKLIYPDITKPCNR